MYLQLRKIYMIMNYPWGIELYMNGVKLCYKMEPLPLRLDPRMRLTMTICRTVPYLAYSHQACPSQFPTGITRGGP